MQKRLQLNFCLRLYMHEFLSGFFNNCSIDRGHYEIYTSMAAVMHISIVR